MSTKLNRQQVSVLIKETIENKLFEHKLTEEIGGIYESRQDLQSAMLIGMMEELSGKKIPDPTMLDEGIWEKAKGMLAKIRLSKSTGKRLALISSPIMKKTKNLLVSPPVLVSCISLLSKHTKMA